MSQAQGSFTEANGALLIDSKLPFDLILAEIKQEEEFQWWAHLFSNSCDHHRLQLTSRQAAAQCHDHKQAMRTHIPKTIAFDTHACVHEHTIILHWWRWSLEVAGSHPPPHIEIQLFPHFWEEVAGYPDHQSSATCLSEEEHASSR